MPKLISLVGGPEDGATVPVEENTTVHRIIKPVEPVSATGAALIGVRVGIYQQKGDRPGVQLFKWIGWEDE